MPAAFGLCLSFFFSSYLSTVRAQVVTNWDNLTKWVQTSAPNEPWTSIASSADGNKLAAVALDGGIYTSTNSGQTWIQETNAPITNWVAVASSCDGNKLVALVGGGGSFPNGGIWTSTNAEQPGRKPLRR